MATYNVTAFPIVYSTECEGSLTTGFYIAIVTSSGALQVKQEAGGAGSTAINVVGTSGAIAPATSSGGLSVSIVAGAGAGSTQVHIVGAANVQAPVTSSFGLLTQVSSGSLIGLSSGTVTLSSVPTVTATAGTNPWSSAPGFNIPFVSASSGFVQISGPVSISTASADAARTFVSVTTISKISSAPGVLWALSAITTSTVGGSLGVPGIVRLYNATTGSVTAGASMVWLLPAILISTSTAAGSGGTIGPAAGFNPIHTFGPRGLSFGTACSVDVGTLTTGAANVANSKVCFIYTS